MRTARVSSCFVLFSLVALLPVPGSAQFAERNVNMVAGTGWPGGDPFLRQQNEPSIAVSTRNPLHLLAGANDYRSVDIPFNAPPRPDDEETGDAWLGIFKSTDGGSRWWSTLLDGYPQQGGSTSPLHGYQAGADPVVRAGDHGMFYYAGIVLNRGDNPLGGVFVARFIDNDNSEVGDPIAYLDTQLIDKGTSGQFIDKPWIAVAPQGNGGQCTVAGQTFPAQTIDLAYSVFVGNDNNIRTKIMFTRSTDCGATWSTPQKLSESYSINQGVSVAIAPNSGTVYVAWRRFHGSNDPDSIVLAKSTDGGASFGKATVVTNITPFEQGTGSASIRTNAYPAIAVDDAGRLYTAWSQRIVNGDGRILLISSSDGGSTWTAPQQVDAYAGRGHQFMPSMRFAAGKLTLAWYDLREDSTMGVLAPVTYSESRVAVGNLALGQPQVVFWTYLADFSPDATIKLLRRHTLDVRVAQADPGAAPSFSSVRLSRYRFGEFPGSSSHTIQQLQINPPNLPLFGQGTKPFLGDYIDLTAYRNGGNARVRHVVWTDNRDVRPPVGTPPDWTKYTPVHSPALGATSRFDPTQAPPPCDVRFSGSRNQNVYTTRVTDGLFAGSPGNSKPLGTIQRAFAVFVQNTSAAPASYRLTITPAQQSIASFLQFSALAEVDVDVPPHSTATRTVFVAASTPPHTRIDIDVTQIGGSGLTTVVSLNPDPATPDIGNPDIGNPDIGNAEVFNPDIGNPDIGNPDIGNPDIGNPDIGNPDIGNPDIGNPDIGNPDIGNPDIGNPDIGNPDIGNPDIGNTDLSNASVTDNSWPVTNEGNTTGGYTVKLLKSGDLPAGVSTQLILNKIYDTPVARDCSLGVEHHRQIVASINNPQFSTIGDLTDPSLDVSANENTLWLAPGESGWVTLRVIDPFHKGLTLDVRSIVTPVAIAHSVNTVDAANGIRQPPTSLLLITTTQADDAVANQPYSTQFHAAGGQPPYSWQVNSPENFTIDGTGLLSGTFDGAGDATIVVTVTDSAAHPHSATGQFPIHIADVLGFAFQSIPPGMLGSAYSQGLPSTGGLAPIHWTIDGGNLPSGLSLAADGTISGTPTTGSSTFELRLTDSSRPPQTVTSSEQFTVLQPPAGCGPTVTLLYDNSNPDAVQNGGTPPTFSTAGQTVCLDSIWTYHWNGGNGAPLGSIGLSAFCDGSCATLGPWQATGSIGQGGAPDVNWTASPPSGTAVLLNGTYTVSDSDPNTWSQNALTKGEGFAKVYVRSYTPTYTVQVRMSYDGNPVTPSPAPEFFLRNNDNNTVVPNDQISWDGGNLATITGIIAGNYGFEVVSQEQASAARFPGSFYGFVSFSAVSASDGGIGMPLRRVIHLTAPNDNAQPLDLGCPSATLSDSPAPGTLSWEAIDVPATYSYDISIYTCSPFAFKSEVLSGATDLTSVSFPALAPSLPGEVYVVTLTADSGGIPVGQLMVVAPNAGGWGWDLRFTVP